MSKVNSMIAAKAVLALNRRLTEDLGSSMYALDADDLSLIIVMVIQDAETCVIDYELYMKSLVTKNSTNGVILNVKLYTVG